MKKFLLINCVALLVISFHLNAQSCSVKITGGSCTNDTLTAKVTDGATAMLKWYLNSGYVYGSDTISSPQNIAVVAGNHGTGGALNQLSFPSGGICTDKNANIYIADYSNDRVMKWAPGATAGVIVAGGHGSGSAANQLSHPIDVFVDDAGNIYVADLANQRVQKWAPGATEGVTVAGGNGSGSSAKQFNGPRALYVDKQGNIYVADTYNYRVQKWKPGATKGVTVAGGNGFGYAANQFAYPIDVYLDSAKNIYVADAYIEDATHHRVQKWAPGATAGVTVAGDNGAGTASNQFGFLLGIYVSGDGTVYAADNGVDGYVVGRVQKFLPGAQYGITVAGGHSSGWDVLSYPKSVSVDKDGFIYVYDANGGYNPRVQKYTPGNGKTNNTFVPTYQGTYQVKAFLINGCEATSSDHVVRTTPLEPEITPTQAGGRGNLCAGGIDTFSVYQWDDHTNYTWKIPVKCSLVANYNDSIILSVPSGFDVGYLTASGTNDCGVGQPDTLIIVGRPVAPGNIQGLKHIYANAQGLIYTIPDMHYNYHWVVPSDAVIVAGQGTASVTVNWGSTSGNVSVNTYNDCGESIYRNLKVTVRNSFAFNTVDDMKAESLNAEQAVVYPNPAHGNAVVKFNSAKQNNYTIELQSLNGIILMRKNITAFKGINTINVDVTNYAADAYIINLKNAEEKIILKLTKE